MKRKMISFVCIATIIVAYFMGNISPAILISRAYGINIKQQGSGNAGTTNVLRVLGKKAAAATFIIDILKGVVSVLMGRLVGEYFLSPEYAILLMLACGLAVFCGHIWPIVFGFKGGKGVATAFGVIITVKPIVGLAALLIGVLVIIITKRVSAGSAIAAMSLPFLAYFLNQEVAAACSPYYIIWAVVMAAIVLIKHRANIQRLIKGEETKLSFKK